MMYLITVNYQASALISQLLASIPKTVDDWCLIIVNNSPDDRDVENLANDRVILLPAHSNLGFGGGCNLALDWVWQRDRHAIVWLINPDAELLPGALETAVSYFTHHPDRSIVGTLIEESTRDVLLGGAFNSRTGEIRAIPASTADLEAEYGDRPWVSGCSLLLQLARFSDCPQFDRGYFLYYEDFDFCQRYLKQGHSVGVTTHIRIRHQPSSITDRTPQLKTEQALYSYLLTLERYTSPATLTWKLIRMVGSLPVLRVTNPTLAIGKFRGIWRYGMRRLTVGRF